MKAIARTRLIQARLLRMTLAIVMLFGVLSPARPVMPAQAATGSFKADEIIVKINPLSGATIAQINAAYGTSTLEGLATDANTYRLRVAAGTDPQALALTMATDARLLFAEPNHLIEPPEASPSRIGAWGGLDPAPYSNQSTITQLGLPQAHAIHTGTNIVVAVIDTGVQLNHPALSGSLTVARYDFIDNDAVPNDEFNNVDDDGDGFVDESAGHGTHVAGIVHLVAPGAKIMPIRALNSDGLGYEFLVARAIDYAVANGADVINLSLGTNSESDLLEEAVKRATQASVVVVSAAGNLNTSVEQYPAAESCSLAVASVGTNDVKSDFSNFGDWVHFSTPGEGIYSPFPPSGYATWSGTSMATPFLAGQVALIRGKRPGLKVREVVNLIAETAHNLNAQNPTHKDELGEGRIHIGASLARLAGAYTPDNDGHGRISGSCVEGEAPLPKPTVAPTATPSPTATKTTQTPTPTPTQTRTPSPSPTGVQTPSATSATATPTATASPTSSPNDGSKVYAKIDALPPAPFVGGWVIGGVAYLANGETEFEQGQGAFAAGVCVRAEFESKNGINTLEEVETKESYKCQGSAPGESANTYSAYGRLESFSLNQINPSLWVISGISYTVNASTTLTPEQGAFAIGAFAEVKYVTSNSQRTALKIETHIAPGAGASSATGLLGTRPSDDWGTWAIGGVSYQGDHAIRLELDSQRLYAPSAVLLVQVNYYTQAKVNYATLIRGLGNRLYLPLAQR